MFTCLYTCLCLSVCLCVVFVSDEVERGIVCACVRVCLRAFGHVSVCGCACVLAFVRIMCVRAYVYVYVCRVYIYIYLFLPISGPTCSCLRARFFFLYLNFFSGSLLLLPLPLLSHPHMHVPGVCSSHVFAPASVAVVFPLPSPFNDVTGVYTRLLTPPTSTHPRTHRLILFCAVRGLSLSVRGGGSDLRCAAGLDSKGCCLLG